MDLAKPQNKFLQSPWLLPGILFLLNLILKGWGLTRHELGYDEPFTIFYAQFPISGLLESLSVDNNPPLFELLMHFWLKIGGGRIDALWVRLPSLFFGALTAAVIGRTGERFFGKKAGWLAGLLFTCSIPFIYYAHETRAYALGTMLTALSIHWFLRSLESPQKLSPRLILGLLNLALIYTHYIGGFVLIVQGLWFLGRAIRQPNEWKLLITWSLIPILGYLPQFWVMFMRFGNGSVGHWVQLSSFPEFYNVLAQYLNQPVTTVAALILFGITVSGLFWSDWEGKKWIRPLLIFFPGLFILVFLVGFKLPLFCTKYLFPAFPALFLLLGAAPFLFRKQWVSLGIGALILILMGATIDLEPEQEEGWQAATQYMEENRPPGACTYLYPLWYWRPWALHGETDAFRDFKRTEEILAKRKIYPLWAGRPVPGKPKECTELWVLGLNDNWKPEVNGMEALLENHFAKPGPVREFPSFTVTTFRPTPR